MYRHPVILEWELRRARAERLAEVERLALVKSARQAPAGPRRRLAKLFLTVACRLDADGCRIAIGDVAPEVRVDGSSYGEWCACGS